MDSLGNAVAIADRLQAYRARLSASELVAQAASMAATTSGAMAQRGASRSSALQLSGSTAATLSATQARVASAKAPLARERAQRYPRQRGRRTGRRRAGLLLDNTDAVVAGTLRGVLNGVLNGAVQQAARSAPPPRYSKAVALDPVELFPFVPYMRYMLPGVISLGMFMTVMIGGGMSYLDDKQRGVHEGYLVTPITKFELVLGQNLAGTIKAAVSGVMLTVLGSLIAGVYDSFQPVRFLALILLVVIVSFAFMSMMSCLVARMNNPMLPRALFGVLNALLYFPSGAIYPVQSLPTWLRWITYVDPFTYAVHGLRVLLLKGAAVRVVLPDVLFLALFAGVMFAGSVRLFRRTL